MWKERVQDELVALTDKMSKLKSALEQPNKFNISERQIHLMEEQYEIMNDYRVILEQRLKEE